MAAKESKRVWQIHHLHARSRCMDPELMNLERNKLRVRGIVHTSFHRLFSNMVPVEMIRHLSLHWTDSTYIRFTCIDIEAEFGGAVYRFRMLGPRNKVLLETVGNYNGNLKSCHIDWLRVFGRDTDVFDAMVQIVERWSPGAPYWRKVIIKAETATERLEYVYIPHRRRKR